MQKFCCRLLPVGFCWVPTSVTKMNLTPEVSQLGEFLFLKEVCICLQILGVLQMAAKIMQAAWNVKHRWNLKDSLFSPRTLRFHDPIWLAHILQMGWFNFHPYQTNLQVWRLDILAAIKSGQKCSKSDGSQRFPPTDPVHKMIYFIYPLKRPFQGYIWVGEIWVFSSLRQQSFGGLPKSWFTVGQWSIHFYEGNPFWTFTKSTVKQCFGGIQKIAQYRNTWNMEHSSEENDFKLEI